MKNLKVFIIAAALAVPGLLMVSAQTGAQTSATPSPQSPIESQSRFTIQFDQVQPEGRLKSLLQKHDLMPFAVFMTLDDQYGRHYVDPGVASLAVIDQARANTVTMENRYGKSLAMRNELIAEGKLPEQAQAKLEAAEGKRANRVNALSRGRPIIYGLWVKGAPAAAEELSKSQGVVVKPAHQLGDRTILEDPRVP